MSGITLIKRYVVTKALSVVYTFLVLLMVFVEFLKNPFKRSERKLRLEPPQRLSDPKYGVHKYIKANNIKLHYVENGDPSKPLMVFLHGYPEFWYSWRYQLQEFSKQYWCVAVDMRGYGDSERPEGVSAYKLETLVADVRDLLRQLGREKFILVAHDWGGIVACKYRDTHPETLSALIVLSSTAHEAWAETMWTFEEQRKKSWYVFFYQMPIVPEFTTQNNNMDIFDEVMLVEGKSTIDQQDLECFKYWFGKKDAFTPPVNYYRANFPYNFKPEVHKENVPFLYALAANDSFLTPQLLFDVMQKRYTNIETTLVKDTGHFMQQEDPVKVNELIKKYLQKLSL